MPIATGPSNSSPHDSAGTADEGSASKFSPMDIGRTVQSTGKSQETP
jgi:hypothetical protein